MLEKETLGILENALNHLDQGFEDLPPFKIKYDMDKLSEIILEVAERMRDNYPYFHPFYAGQMLKPPHPIARVAYMLAMWINPNNHALDGSRASSPMEKSAVSEIAKMFGWETFLGHLTSGGTMANLEALWISREINPGKKVVASEQAHYVHPRISEVLGIDFESVPGDMYGRMDIPSLETILARGNVGTVVATIGTTAAGSVDQLNEILRLQKKYKFRVHADAAYGGYFTLVQTLDPKVREAFDNLLRVDSIVVDPHKHGLQPYGCGCILFKDPEVGRFYKHDSPYTYFTSEELHLGEISLECSRAGASAVALWATQKLLPLVQGGEFSKGLENGRRAALSLFNKLKSDDRFRTIFPPSLDILIWAPSGKSASQISKKTDTIFNQAAKKNLHLAKFKCPSYILIPWWKDVVFDQDSVECLRSCLMKPQSIDWIESIWQILDQVSDY